MEKKVLSVKKEGKEMERNVAKANIGTKLANGLKKREVSRCQNVTD
jgi:hypothetical protein